MKVTKEELHDLILKKLNKAGLTKEHSKIAADVLVSADLRGVHSHGAMRVEYYSERISKGGINTEPNFMFEKINHNMGVFHGDNGMGHVAAKLAMDEGIKIAEEYGIAFIGVKSISHSGALSYFVKQAAEKKLVSISMCQSDPMVVPYGGAEPYYGTNPIAFSAPGKDGEMIIIDMATTVQAWGKILHARSKNENIPNTWAVDIDGNPTEDPFKVNALKAIAGPKGYALGMMVDILSGILLGLPYGDKVTSMYKDMSEPRNLGHIHIIINPKFLTNINEFMEDISNTIKDLNSIKPATGFDKVRYPGQGSIEREKKYEKEGIEIVDDILEYLKSDTIHNDRYDNKGAFAK